MAALIIIYLRGINHIPILLIVCIIFFFFARFLLLFAIEGELLESTFAPPPSSPSSHIIVLLMAMHSMLHLKETCVTIFFSTGCFCLFTLAGKTLILLGHFLLFSSERCYSTIQIINKLPLSSGRVRSHATLRDQHVRS